MKYEIPPYPVQPQLLTVPPHRRKLSPVTILLVCADEQRLNRLKDAIQSAGFRTISARRLNEAWTRTDFFDFGAVVIDHELKNDIAASAFGQRFITLNLNEDSEPVAVVMELTNLFSRGSELVQ